MKKWHKSTRMDLGRILLRWRHRDVQRFYWKIASWILSAFIIGIFVSILCVGFGVSEMALRWSRAAFFISLVGGVLNSFFIYVVTGSEYRITDKAFVAVRPMIGYEPLAAKLASAERPLGAKLEHLTWDEIKEAREKDGQLALILKSSQEELLIGVEPVVYLAQSETVKRPAKSAGAESENLDRETLKLILLKIRELKRTSPKG
jgi:hypothetical protein